MSLHLNKNSNLGTNRIFKIENSLFFANCEEFEEELKRISNLQDTDKPKESRFYQKKQSILSIEDTQIEQIKKPKTTELILDFSSVNYIDTNGVNALKQSILDLKQKNVFVYICGAQGNFICILNLQLFG